MMNEFTSCASLFEQFINRLRFTSSKVSALSYLYKTSVLISSIIDVGVQKSTHVLIHCFPNDKNFLFEPVTSFHSSINRNYENLDYVFFPTALSSSNGSFFLIHSFVYNDGIVTHPQIADKPLVVDHTSVISCSRISKSTFDSHANSFPLDFLLKIDVGGSELDILKGALTTLDKASVIVIEALWYDFVSRFQFILYHFFSFSILLINVFMVGLFGSMILFLSIHVIRL